MLAFQLFIPAKYDCHRLLYVELSNTDQQLFFFFLALNCIFTKSCYSKELFRKDFQIVTVGLLWNFDIEADWSKCSKCIETGMNDEWVEVAWARDWVPRNRHHHHRKYVVPKHTDQTGGSCTVACLRGH